MLHIILSYIYCGILYYTTGCTALWYLSVFFVWHVLHHTKFILNFNTGILLFSWQVLFCIAYHIIRTCHDCAAVPQYDDMMSVFGFSAAVYLFVCLEASHTIYSLAPFVLPDRPIVSHWCTVVEIHTKGRLLLIHQRQADSRHVENSIHTLFFQKEEENLSNNSTSPCGALKAKGSQLHTYQAGADSSSELMGSSAKHIDSAACFTSAPH